MNTLRPVFRVALAVASLWFASPALAFDLERCTTVTRDSGLAESVGRETSIDLFIEPPANSSTFYCRFVSFRDGEWEFHLLEPIPNRSDSLSVLYLTEQIQVVFPRRSGSYLRLAGCAEYPVLSVPVRCFGDLTPGTAAFFIFEDFDANQSLLSRRFGINLGEFLDSAELRAFERTPEDQRSVIVSAEERGLIWPMVRTETDQTHFISSPLHVRQISEYIFENGAFPEFEITWLNREQPRLQSSNTTLPNAPLVLAQLSNLVDFVLGSLADPVQ